MSTKYNFKDIIDEEYEKNTRKFNVLLPNCNISRADIISDSSGNKTMNLYCDKTKKNISVKYELLGSRDTKCELFIWGSSMQIIDKTIVGNCKIIKKYKSQIEKYIYDKKFKDIDYLERILYYLSHNVFFINNDNVHDLVKISAFVVKSVGVVILTGDNIVTYYLVSDIIGT